MNTNRINSNIAGSVGERSSPSTTFIGWMLIVLMILPKDFVSLFNPPDAQIPTNSIGSAINSILWLTMMIIGPLLVYRRMNVAKKVMEHLNFSFLLFCGLFLLSISWSAAPGITTDRFRRLLIMVFGCMALVTNGWNPHRLQQVLRPVITALLVGSLIYGALCPQLAIHQSESHELKNAWHGLAFQKNTFGALGAYGVILWFHGWLSRQTSSLSSILWGGVSLLCVLLSHSSTSLMISAFSILLLGLMLKSPSTLRRYTPYFIGIFVFLVGLYALITLDVFPGLKAMLGPISAITGKDAASATGRAPIWDLIKDEIGRHPWLGIGYGAYWTGSVPGTPSYVFTEKLHFYAGSAHNGYLEVTNDLGYVGLLCLITYILTMIKQSLRLWRIDKPQAALILALIFQQGLNNLSEAEWFQVTAFNFVITTMATFFLARALSERHLPPPRASAPTPTASPTKTRPVNFASQFLRRRNRN